MALFDCMEQAEQWALSGWQLAVASGASISSISARVSLALDGENRIFL